MRVRAAAAGWRLVLPVFPTQCTGTETSAVLPTSRSLSMSRATPHSTLLSNLQLIRTLQTRAGLSAGCRSFSTSKTLHPAKAHHPCVYAERGAYAEHRRRRDKSAITRQAYAPQVAPLARMRPASHPKAVVFPAKSTIFAPSATTILFLKLVLQARGLTTRQDSSLRLSVRASDWVR